MYKLACSRSKFQLIQFNFPLYGPFDARRYLCKTRKNRKYLRFKQLFYGWILSSYRYSASIQPVAKTKTGKSKTSLIKSATYPGKYCIGRMQCFACGHKLNDFACGFHENKWSVSE